MENDFEEQQRAQQAIRQNMEWRETGELTDIWLDQNTDEWTPEALQVVGQILRERGVDLQMLGEDKTTKGSASERPLPPTAYANGPEEDEIHQAVNRKIELRALGEKYMDELEEKSTPDLAWLFRTQLVYLQAIRQALADRGIDTEGYEESDLGLPAETLKCANCDADMPGNARYCPQCGAVIYPDDEETGEE